MNSKRLNIGLDIHGCIDQYIPLFEELCYKWASQGHIVHIITGEPKETAREATDDLIFQHFFSIVDYHVEQNTPSLRQDDNGHYWVDRDVWVATKGNYAKRVGLDIHFDDQVEYAPYFPEACCFIHVPKTNFERILKTLDTISIL